MAIDIVGCINDLWTATPEVKVRMLEDFCAQYGYEEYILDPETRELIPNPVTRKEFANSKITLFIKESVEAYRIWVLRQAIEHEELELK